MDAKDRSKCLGVSGGGEHLSGEIAQYIASPSEGERSVAMEAPTAPSTLAKRSPRVRKARLLEVEAGSLGRFRALDSQGELASPRGHIPRRPVSMDSVHSMHQPESQQTDSSMGALSLSGSNSFTPRVTGQIQQRQSAIRKGRFRDELEDVMNLLPRVSPRHIVQSRRPGRGVAKSGGSKFTQYERKKVPVQSLRPVHVEELASKRIQTGSCGEIFCLSTAQCNYIYGTNLATGAEVAVKRIFKSKRVAYEQGLRELRFLQKNLNQESNFIITLRFAGETKEAFIMGMEYCRRGDLLNLYEMEEMTLFKALVIGGEIASGIGCLHRHGVIHADIKPENVGITHDGHVKLLDFGLSSMLFEEGEFNNLSGRLETPAEAGTIAYMAPEVLKRRRQGLESDWWSFGVLFYEAVFGALPWNSNDPNDLCLMICSEPLKFQPQLMDNEVTPPILFDFVQRLLSKHPTLRLGFHGDFDSIASHPMWQRCSRAWKWNWDVVEAAQAPVHVT